MCPVGKCDYRYLQSHTCVSEHLAHDPMYRYIGSCAKKRLKVSRESHTCVSEHLAHDPMYLANAYRKRMLARVSVDTIQFASVY